MSSKTGSVGRIFRVMRGKPLGALGGLLIIALVATALLAPMLAPNDPIKIKSSDRLHARLNHPLGTDDFGRDIDYVITERASRCSSAPGGVAISTLLAAIIGILSGYYGDAWTPSCNGASYP
jgi:ABC-type dipeptide/oligopeptide/nickel transport system permease subunit